MGNLNIGSETGVVVLVEIEIRKASGRKDRVMTNSANR